jgi:hypothetical protein
LPDTVPRDFLLVLSFDGSPGFVGCAWFRRAWPVDAASADGFEPFAGDLGATAVT